MTIWASMWNSFFKTTVMTIHGLGIHMKGQGNVTIWALIHIATITAHDKT